MKNNFKLLYCMLSVLIVFGMAGCKKNDNLGGTGAPAVTRVRLISKTDTIANVVHRVTLDSTSTYDDRKVVPFDSTVTAGRLNTQYAIEGENLAGTTQVLFNGYSAYFNPTLVTDKVIIITIPEDVPWGPGTSNKLTVKTMHGQVDYDFGILQPPPVIDGFESSVTADGEVVTITGSIFNEVSAVRFDDIPATIVGTPTATEIKVKIPAGVSQAYIYVTTPGGTSKSALAYGFKYVIFDEALNTDDDWVKWGGWGTSVQDLPSTEHPKSGTNSIKVSFNDDYGALQLHPNESFPLPNGYSSLKLSIYGGANATATSKIAVYIKSSNGIDPTDAQKKVLTLVPGVYTPYQIPLSDFGNNPADITELVIQNYGTSNLTIYVDDIGLN